MKRHSLGFAIIFGAACLGISTATLAQQSSAQPQKFDLGKIEYESRCATCHGMTGKGDGPISGLLTRKASDLTVLAKNNNGILPVAAMYDIVMGEKDVPGHGTRDMPVWGKFYSMQAARYYLDVPYDPEAYVRARILALIEYINRLQVK